jgi:hypothetical protein
MSTTERPVRTDLPPEAEALLYRLNRWAEQVIADFPDRPWGGTQEQWDAWRATHQTKERRR